LFIGEETEIGSQREFGINLRPRRYRGERLIDGLWWRFRTASREYYRYKYDVRCAHETTVFHEKLPGTQKRAIIAQTFLADAFIRPLYCGIIRLH
jgi:hypothetical protein